MVYWALIFKHHQIWPSSFTYVPKKQDTGKNLPNRNMYANRLIWIIDTAVKEGQVHFADKLIHWNIDPLGIHMPPVPLCKPPYLLFINSSFKI